MEAKIETLKKRMILGLSWCSRCLILVVMPTVLLWQLLPRSVEIYSNTFRVHLEQRGGDLYRKDDGYSHLLDSGLVLYGSEKPDLEFVPLDVQLAVPKTLITKLLKLPEEPIRHRLCFYVKSYFTSSDDKRVAVDDYPIRIMLKNGTLLEISGDACEKRIEGAVMMGAAPGAFNMNDLFNAFNQVGVLMLSGADLQFDQTKALTGGIVVNYTVKGDQIFINGKEFRGRIEKDKNNNLSLFLDPTSPNMIGKIDSVQELTIHAQPYKFDVFVFGMVLLAGWWVIAFSFLDNLVKVWHSVICPAFSWAWGIFHEK